MTKNFKHLILVHTQVDDQTRITPFLEKRQNEWIVRACLEMQAFS